MFFGLRTNKLKNEMKSISLENMTPQMWRGLFNTEMLAMETAYAEVPWFGAALDHRKNAFSNMPWDLMKLGSDKILANESDYEDELSDNQELLIFRTLPQIITDLDMYGAGYMLYEVNEYGMNGAWRRLHPSSIRPDYDARSGQLRCFHRHSPVYEKFELDDPDFFYLWMPTRKSENMPGEGVGIRALRAATGLHNKDVFQATFFKNGAINPTLVQIKGFSTLPDDEKDRIKKVLQKLMTGIANAFKVTPLDGDVNVTSLMQNLKDMAMTESTNQQREDISTATGVPQSLLFSNAANFATAQQDDFNFYDKTIVPLASNIVEVQLNERFFVPRGFRIKYRKERLEVYQKLELENTDKLMSLRNANIIDDNEVRTNVGFAERADDFEVPERLVNPADKEAQEDNETDEGARTSRLQDEEDSEYQKMKTDFQKWERLAVKRWGEGKPKKALSFSSAAIPAITHAAVVGALDAAQNVDDVKSIFAHATEVAPLWVAYA